MAASPVTHKKNHIYKLRMQYEVVNALAHANDFEECSNKILEILGESLHLELGALWVPDSRGCQLVFKDVWTNPLTDVREFVEDSKTRQFLMGMGLPGRVWEKSAPVWIENICEDKNFPRLALAARCGLKGAFAFPLSHGKKVLAVMEFFSGQMCKIDNELMQMVTSLGQQIGLFMNRLQVEDDLRRTIVEREEFLSIASHELKTPLATLMLHLQMLERNVRPIFEKVRNYDVEMYKGAQEHLRGRLHECVKQGQKISDLIDDLLDLTRIRVGRLVLQPEVFDLGRLTQQIVERFKTDPNLKNLITTSLESRALIGRWDIVRIEQVIVNLIANAIKYGEGKPIIVETKLDAETNQAILSVRDHGVGISDEMLPKIFERFERADESAKIKGLGLGLYITRQIIESHEGKVYVQSKPREGSTFTIELPLFDEIN